MDIFYNIIDFATPRWMIAFMSFLNGFLLLWRDRLGGRNKCSNYPLHAIGLFLSGSFYIYIIIGKKYGLDLADHNSIVHFTILWQLGVWLFSSICDIRGAYGHG